MKIVKIRNVKTPSRGTSVAAGLDFYVPEFDGEFYEALKEKNSGIVFEEGGFLLYPHCRVNIPSGIKVNIPEGYALIAFNKSGVSLKYGFDVGASVIDEDYRGEIHLSLINTTNYIQKINYGQKIIQFILLPVNYEGIEVVNSEEECFDRESERGSGAFGSTGEK